ncbi:MAG: phospholipase [Spirochaetaceae bacterium]|nr:MAG: phospholipase [Spirochaetaceae bacterium]
MKPHAGRPILQRGEQLSSSRAVAIMIHGRGASPDDILALVDDIEQEGYCYLAPHASENSWYPFSFLYPVKTNEPGLSSALHVIGDVLRMIGDAGIPRERTIILGFSQGACLALEFAYRHPARYGAVLGLSGGLIGPEGTTWKHNGDLAGTPVFLGCSDIDFHIPKNRVEDSAAVFSTMGADVTLRLYPGMPHTVNNDEIAFIRNVMERVIRGE